jgi:hypothetical protein
MNSQTIVLSSQTATSINANYNKASFELRHLISLPPHIRPRVSATSFKYSNVFANITSSTCTFYNSIADITVSAGRYTLTTLITALSGVGFTFVFDEVSLLLTVSHASAFVIQDGANSMHFKLGFNVPSANGISHTATHAVRLQGVDMLHVTLPNMHISSNGVTGSSINDNVIISVPNSVLIAHTLAYTPQNRIAFQTQQHIRSIDVEIVDENGSALDFLGSSWYLVLLFQFEYLPQLTNLSNPFLAPPPPPPTPTPPVENKDPPSVEK